MRYSGLIKEDFENGPGVGVTLFTQGCPHHCYNCFNPETWSYDGGKELTWEVKDEIYNAVRKLYITRFSILGGEPFIEENIEDLIRLVDNVKLFNPRAKVWVWTGYTFEELAARKDRTYVLLFMIDVLVDGPYIEELKDLTLPYCGSSNQRVIDIEETVWNNKVTLYK